jgi:uncharacterized Ntn-hydrolase superfamily protein
MSYKILLPVLLVLTAESAMTWDNGMPGEGTYSIIARDRTTGELGMAVQSKAYAAGNRTMTAKGGIAVIAHQASSNPMYGELGIDLLQRGMTPQEALDFMVSGDRGRENRQVAILDIEGRTAAWTGSRVQEWKGHRCTADYCVQGNIIVGPEVLDGMVQRYEAAAGQPLAERLLAALDGGQAAGGDRRGMQAAALLIVKPLAGAARFGDRVIDIRVDDHRMPLIELRRVFNVQRASERMSEAIFQIRTNQPEEALRTALAARDLAPENDNVWVGLAYVYLLLERRPDCFEALRKAVELNPANKSELPKNPIFEPLRPDPEFGEIFD